MNAILREVLGVLALSGVAAASPATDIFKQATDVLSKHYYGTATNLTQTIAKHQALLDAACAKDGDACAVKVGTKQIADLFTELDWHLAIRPPAAPAPGSTAKAPVFGWSSWPNAAAGEAYIYDLVPNGPAMRAGVMRGDRVIAVNGTKLQPQASMQAMSESWTKLLPAAPSQDSVKFTILRNNGKSVETLEVAFGRGTEYDEPGLPYLYKPAGAPEGVMVLRLQGMSNTAVAQRLHDLVRQAQAQGAKALIVDLMGYSSADFATLNATAGALIGNFEYSYQTPDGKFASGYKDGVALGYPGKKDTLTIKDPVVWTGKIALLIQESDSAGPEFLSHLVRNAKRGIVVGETTPGYLQVVPDYYYLTDGSMLVVPAYRPLNADGTPFPERIVPDVTVTFDEQANANSGWNVVMERAWKELGF